MAPVNFFPDEFIQRVMESFPKSPDVSILPFGSGGYDIGLGRVKSEKPEAIPVTTQTSSLLVPICFNYGDMQQKNSKTKNRAHVQVNHTCLLEVNMKNWSFTHYDTLVKNPPGQIRAIRKVKELIRKHLSKRLGYLPPSPRNTRVILP